MEITVGRWRARVVEFRDADDALALRARLFRGGDDDRDANDPEARHLTIYGASGPAACARVTPQSGSGIRRGYTGAHYDLASFAATFPRALEVGRIGFAPGPVDPDVPRLMLGIFARLVEDHAADVLFGCASFPWNGAGTARLAECVAPDPWRPKAKAPETAPLSGPPGALPPLLRTWLAMGAGVSDRAVIDRDLGTRHVFAGLPVSVIPPARARRLADLLSPV
ncbi:GNAT family N-acetyltransferase [Jannaschia sp. S6380]|uniref:GNAT family N-acetyltransferase n=1 Tax=Jannaschia sp. S6380 TaxID=2926408 RepID=UPI001FF41E79|nr:GNAT family N-acetyltransferase [Jannaschia sp. S6380]MCK0166121.1 GNAT family N-acetyltransferase [Jannaschia sp. S6380]